MPWTNQERNRYQEDYKRENYDTIKVLTPKGTRERLKAEADRRGLPSVNALLNILISDAIHISPDPIPTDPAGADTAGNCTSSDDSGKENPEE